MPIPNTKINIASALSSGIANRLLPNTPGDFSQLVGVSVPAWVSSIADLNGDGIAEVVVGVGGDDDKALDAGRIVVHRGQSTGGTAVTLTDDLNDIIIDGINAGDLAGATVSSIADINGDGLAEILIGAPGMDGGAGTAFVVWGQAVGGGIDLADLLASGADKGFAINGALAGDLAGTSIMSIADQNGDGISDLLIGAPGVTLPAGGGGGGGGGGGPEGAVYVVYGKDDDVPINLADVELGTGGFRIVGEDGGNGIGNAIGTVGDMNGDGRSEILIGVSDGAGDAGDNLGAAYVVFGKANGTEVDLRDIADGDGGFRILGALNDKVGSAISGIGDVNGDGVDDILVGASDTNSAYVVFGKSTTTEVDLAAIGSSGYRIIGQAIDDLDTMSVTGGTDLNRDGIKDLVIGAAYNNEGGEDAGAVYVVWGGGLSTVNLALVARKSSARPAACSAVRSPSRRT